MEGKDTHNMFAVREITKQAVAALGQGLGALNGKRSIAFGAPMLREDKGNGRLQEVFEEVLKDVTLPPGLQVQINYLSRIEHPWWMLGKERTILVWVNVLLVDYTFDD